MFDELLNGHVFSDFKLQAIINTLIESILESPSAKTMTPNLLTPSLKSIYTILWALSTNSALMWSITAPAQSAPAEQAKPPALTKKHSFKGWELYSWQEGNHWMFSLLWGTNRLKSCNEIKSPKSKLSLSELEHNLTQLAEGEWVSWCIESSLTSTPDCSLAYPPEAQVLRLRNLCSKLRLHESDGFKSLTPSSGP